MRIRTVAAVLTAVGFLLLLPALAGEAEEKRIGELEKLVEQLRAELAALRAAAGVPADRLAELERRIELLARELEKLRIGEAAEEGPLESRYGLGPAASKVYRKARGVSVAGYGEAVYENFDSDRDDGEPSGRTDQADLLRAVLYFGYKWNDRILFNSEIEFEHASTGEEGEVSVEFAGLDFLLSEAANVRAGLVLVPMGFINEQHEPPTFLGARRPDVERAIIPATWREMGVGGFGDAGSLSWRAYLVAGLDASGFTDGGIRDGRQDGSKSKAKDLALTARLDWIPRPGLLLGGSLYAGDSGQGLEDARGRTIDAATRLAEVHVEWKWRGLEARALAARGSIGDAARLNEATGREGIRSIGRRQSGYYAQAGFDVLTFAPASGHSLIPFVRYEAFDTQKRVPEGFERNPARDVRVRTAGLVWKPISSVAVKADWQDFENRAGTGVDQVNLAIGFIF